MEVVFSETLVSVNKNMPNKMHLPIPLEWKGTGISLRYESTVVWQTGVLLLEMLKINIGSYITKI